MTCRPLSVPELLRGGMNLRPTLVGRGKKKKKVSGHDRVCSSQTVCMYECVGGRGGNTPTHPHTHTNTGHEEEGGVCSKQGRRREEARPVALSDV